MNDAASKVDEEWFLAEVSVSQRRKVFSGVEYQAIDVPLEDLIIDGKLSVYPLISKYDFFKLYIKKDQIVFQTAGYIGLIPINDKVVLDIRTRVPVRNLERMLFVAHHSPKILEPFERKYATHEFTFPSLIETLTAALIDSLIRLEQFGIYREYVNLQRNTSFPRGRIIVGKSLQRNLSVGSKHRVHASWYERSADVAVNQCIKFALWTLAEKFHSVTPKKGWRAWISKINRFYSFFDGVSLDASRSFLANRLVRHPIALPESRKYYTNSLILSKIIIENRGIEFDRGGDDILLPSMVMKLENLFEEYIRAVLKEKAYSRGLQLEVLNGQGPGSKPLFDRPTMEKATPDIVFKRNNGLHDEFPLIIDVKYKNFDRPKREDINQVIAYGFSYRATRVVILHPKTESGLSGMRAIGEIDNVALFQYAFDLASDTPSLEEEHLFQALLTLMPEYALV
ncbi:MAG: hypothetical protein ABIP75_14645 [Pyrinomonadaceae bacterium]